MAKSSSEILHEYFRIIVEADKDIDQSDVKGEEYTGYENEDGKGLFECRNCTYSDEHSSCGHPIMMEHSKQPRVENGRVKIDPKGCCEYVNRKGK